MDYSIYDFIGNIGVFFIILGYLLLQTNKIKSSDLKFSLLNIFGAGLIIISLLKNFNISAFIIEAFWILISIIGIYNYFKKKSN